MKYIFKKKLNIVLVTIFDAFGYFFLKIFYRHKQASKKESKSVLIIRMDHLGDVLAATALPKVIKESLPGCRVIFLTASWAAPLLENNPFVDEVLVFDPSWFSRKGYLKTRQSLSWMQLVRTLKLKKIDAALGLRGDLRENFIMALAGIRERIGYGVTGGGFLLTKEAVYRKDAHESAHTLDLLNALGIRREALEPRLYFSDAEVASFNERLGRLGIQGEEKYVGFLMGAGSASKEWPVENTDAFLKLFSEGLTRYKMLIVGSSLARSADLHGVDGRRVINLAGETSLRELCLLAGKSACFIGPDSGPTHIAAALGVPAIFLFSGTNRLEQWKPLSESAVILSHPVPCSPCGLEVCPIKGHPCMSGISPDKLLKTLETRLK